MPVYQKPDPAWNIDPEAALQEMERRIADKQAFQNFGNCKAIEKLPRNIGDIGSDEIHLNYTNISDLNGLLKIPTVSKLSLGKRVSDLSVVRQLPNLNSLDCSFCEGIADISSISSCTNLRHLQLSVGDVSDLSAIENLEALEYLVLNNYRGQKIPTLKSSVHVKIDCVDQVEIDGSQFAHWPSLQYLQISTDSSARFSKPFPLVPRLETLLIQNIEISDLTNLGLCQSLTRLELRGCSLRDIRPLAQLNKLKFLNVSNSQIEYISSLSHLSSLRVLAANNTDVSDLDGWNKHSGIRELNLSDTPISSLEPLAGTRLTRLETANTPVSHIKPITNCPELSYLNLMMTSVRDLTGIEKLGKLAYLDIRYSRVDNLDSVLRNSDFLTKSTEPVDFREAGNHGFFFADTPIAISSPELQEISKRSSPQSALLQYFKNRNRDDD